MSMVSKTDDIVRMPLPASVHDSDDESVAQIFLHYILLRLIFGVCRITKQIGALLGVFNELKEIENKCQDNVLMIRYKYIVSQFDVYI